MHADNKQLFGAEPRSEADDFIRLADSLKSAVFVVTDCKDKNYRNLEYVM